MIEYVAIYRRPADDKNPRSALFILCDGDFKSVFERANWYAKEAFNPPPGHFTMRGTVMIYNLTNLALEVMITHSGAHVWDKFAKQFVPSTEESILWRFSQEPTTAL